MGRKTLRRQIEIVPGAMPEITALTEQIVRLKCSAGIEPQPGEIESDPTRLRMPGVKVANHNDNVREIAGCFAVADHLGVIRLMKSQIPHLVEGGILAADPVEARDQVLQAPAAVYIPTLQFVLLGVQVFFAARFPGRVLAKLKRRTVDPVVCPYGSGKNDADSEGGPAARLQKLGQDVRRIWP